jgi:hypothetical protein
MAWLLPAPLPVRQEPPPAQELQPPVRLPVVPVRQHLRQLPP